MRLASAQRLFEKQWPPCGFHSREKSSASLRSPSAWPSTLTTVRQRTCFCGGPIWHSTVQNGWAAIRSRCFRKLLPWLEPDELASCRYLDLRGDKSLPSRFHPHAISARPGAPPDCPWARRPSL